MEIGSGGGFYREIRRELVSLDVRPGADVDVVGSALRCRSSGSITAVVMLDVLHHLPDAEAFFRECDRVLRRGGRVCMIEPYVSALSRRLIRPLHHEPWDEQGPWTLPQSGPMTGANMALPSIVFFRDRSRYERAFPNLPVDRVRLHTNRFLPAVRRRLDAIDGARGLVPAAPCAREPVFSDRRSPGEHDDHRARQTLSGIRAAGTELMG